MKFTHFFSLFLLSTTILAQSAEEYLLKATNFFHEGKYDSSLFYSNRGLEIDNTTWHTRYNLISERGWLNNILGYYSDAKKDLYKAYEMTLDTEWRSDSSYYVVYYYDAVNKLGAVYDNLGQYDSAIFFYKTVEDSVVNTEKGACIAHILGNLALVYANLEDFENALKYDQKSLKLELKYGYGSSIMATFFNISYDFFDLGQYDSALYYNDQALLVYDTASRAIDVDGPGEFERHKKGVWSLRVKVLQQLGRLDEALNMMMKYQDEQDSLNQVDKMKLAKELEAEYQAEKKEAENKKLLQEAQQKEAIIFQQRVWISVVGLFLTVVLTLLFFLYRSRVLLKTQKEEIERQSLKLKALDQFKSRFFANVSHDFRTPLTLIQGYLEQLSKGDSYLDHAARESLEKAKRNTRKLSAMTDEIRDLVALDEDKLKLQYESVIISEYVRRIVALFHSRSAMQSIDLTFKENVEEGLHVHLDPFQFEKVLYNLISNALKFTPTGGRVDVLLMRHSDDEVSVIVKDDGPGISPEHQAFIFDRFFQSSEVVSTEDEGIGIGLALVMELVELHGGTVRVESQPGEGTAFHIDLPLNHDQPLTSEPAESSYLEKRNTLLDADRGERLVQVDLTENQKTDAKTILLVEDHLEIQEYIKGLIDDEYIVRVAGDGQEAVAVLAKHKIDLVITDLMMPIMNGHELIEAMKKDESLKNIPVLVVSARNSPEDLMQVLEAGVNDFLSKPFSSDELQLRIRNAMSQQHGQQDLWEALANKNQVVPEVNKNLLAKVNRLILDRIDDPKLTVNDLAEELITSKRTTFRIISDLTGMSPKEYMLSVRFEYVTDLLKKRKLRSLSEAAQAIGMSNTTHFSKLYEKKRGKKPSEYLNVKVS